MVKSREPTTFTGGRAWTSCFAEHCANSPTGVWFYFNTPVKADQFPLLENTPGQQHTSPYLMAILTAYALQNNTVWGLLDQQQD